MPIISFSPELDVNYYRNSYPELNHFPDSILNEHYARFAVEQGRSTCVYDRREFLHGFLHDTINSKSLKVLEIGCGNNPFLIGKTVKYFETMDSEGLKRRNEKIGRDVSRVPKKIDFVSPNGDLGVVDETFDIVFSAHVIEHCPNLVEHLRGVSRILNKGGLYILFIPDKRYCFDHYHPESTVSEVIDAFANERKIPRLADVINLAYTRTHNNSILHWLGEHGKRYGYRDTPLADDLKVEVMGEYFFDDGKGISREKFLPLIEKYSEALAQGEYISAHNWRFTPDSFRYIINLLNALEFIDLPLYRCCHTIWGRQEFLAMLEKI
ncbi:MAG: methyltransferase domain-containing protein [Selenomonadaceae bacterium]|nr:methyltransferase domain-containing protein [Selenomonadaceae bacterium]MBQ3726028.1 methyltransferase domain-containing protein [Selenomonadaceae bacterium]MBQ9497022.1 methyltransferase domain-containing protein [Selenomonadaceae bacterium]